MSHSYHSIVGKPVRYSGTEIAISFHKTSGLLITFTSPSNFLQSLSVFSFTLKHQPLVKLQYTPLLHQMQCSCETMVLVTQHHLLNVTTVIEKAAFMQAEKNI